jgi:hypothetical protein
MWWLTAIIRLVLTTAALAWIYKELTMGVCRLAERSLRGRVALVTGN